MREWSFAASRERVDHVLGRPDVRVPAPEVDRPRPRSCAAAAATRASSRAKYCSGRRSIRSGLGRTGTMLVPSLRGLHFPGARCRWEESRLRGPAHARNLQRRQPSRARPGARHERRPPPRGRHGRHPSLRDGDAVGRDVRLQHVHRRRSREHPRAPARRPHARGGVGGRSPPRRPHRLRRLLRGDRARGAVRDRVPADRLRRAHPLGLGPHAPAAQPRTGACSSTGSSSRSPSASTPPRLSPTRSASSSTSPTTTP